VLGRREGGERCASIEDSASVVLGRREGDERCASIDDSASVVLGRAMTDVPVSRIAPVLFWEGR
jgi:hypothetical protein